MNTPYSRMQVNEMMVDAAMQKARDAGLVPRRCTTTEMQTYRAIVHDLIEAALNVAAEFSLDPLHSEADVEYGNSSHFSPLSSDQFQSRKSP